MAKWPAELRPWCGVATHVHSTFPHNPTCEGKQSIIEVAEMAIAFGLEGVAFAEHTTDPGQPAAVSGDLLEIIRQQAAEVERGHAWLYTGGSGLWLWSGVEANIMPDGSLDAPSDELASRVRYVIASQHGGLGVGEKDPDSILDRLLRVCADPHVDTIGHPTRYNDDVVVDWPQILAQAALTNTAVELNFNLWFSKGPGRGRVRVKNDPWFAQQVDFWLTWMRQVASSGAPVVIGLDVHNAGMWPQANAPQSWSPSIEALTQFILLIQQSGIYPERIINSTAELFGRWLDAKKADRGLLIE